MTGLTHEQAAAIRAEARRIEEEGLGGKSRLMREMVANWKEFNPRMYQSLRRLNLVWDYAMVTEMRYIERTIHLVQTAKMNPSDAERECAEMLLMTSEPVEDEETTI